jgi:hypothetical protein
LEKVDRHGKSIGSAVSRKYNQCRDDKRPAKEKRRGILIPIDDTIVSKSSTFGHQRRDTHYAQQLDVIPARQLSMHHAIVKKISTDPNIIHLPFLSSMIIGWTSLTFSSRAITK